MADRVNKATRSNIMRSVPSRDTKHELVVRRALHSAGYRFRLHRPDLPGTPDIILPRYRLAIFVHGCFWHGHDCRGGRLPKSNVEFWTSKIQANSSRDARVQDALQRQGWQVVVLWTCRLKDDLSVLLGSMESLRAAQRRNFQFDERPRQARLSPKAD